MAKKKKRTPPPVPEETERIEIEHDELEQIDPDELMGDINKLSFFGTTMLSLLIHVLLIGGTSVGFIMLCAEYNTLDPKAEIRARTEQRRTEERAKKIAEQRARYAARKAKTPKDGGDKGGRGPKSTGGDGNAGKTDVEGNTGRKPTTLPTGTGVGLDDVKIE